MNRLYTATLAALLLPLGCSGSGEECRTDNDCFMGEVCRDDRTCGPDAGANNGGSNNGGANNGGANNGGANNGGSNNGGSNNGGSNNGGSNNGGANNGVSNNGGANNGGSNNGAACVVDRFTHQCTDDAAEPDDSWIDADRLAGDANGGAVGCYQEFEPFDQTFDRTMCQNDGADWFQIDFYPCADASWILEFQLDVLDDCDDADVAFEPLSFDCEHPNVNCSVLDGKRTVQMIIDESFQNRQTAFFGVELIDRDDVTFDYQIRVVARQ